MNLVGLFKKYTSKNVFVLITGTFLSQLIPFLISPILTRIFSPEEFGMFGLYFSISMILSVFITGRYEMAIMLPKSDKDAVNIVGLSLIITFVISILLLIAVIFFKHQAAALMKSENIENWLFTLPLTMFSIGVYQAFNYWNNRKEKYKRLASSRVIRSLNTSTWSLVLGFTLLKKGGLILGDAIGQSVSCMFLAGRTWKEDKNFYPEIQRSNMKEQAIRYKQFPIYNVASGLSEKMSGQMPVLLLSSFFGEALTGFFSFSQRIVSAPGAIIARAFGDVFRQKASVEFAENGNCKQLFIKTFRQLFFVSVIPFILFYFFAPPLFGFVFGERWIVAGEYAQIMTLLFFLQFIVSPLSNMFLVAEKQKIDLYMQVILLVGVLLAFIGGYKIFNDPKLCVLLYTFVYSFKYLVELMLSYKFSKGTK